MAFSWKSRPIRNLYGWPVLIPDPIVQVVAIRWDWIWDQSLLTVRINTRTQGIRPGSCMVLRTEVPTLRSIVTDHYLLDTATSD